MLPPPSSAEYIYIYIYIYIYMLSINLYSLDTLTERDLGRLRPRFLESALHLFGRMHDNPGRPSLVLISLRSHEVLGMYVSTYVYARHYCTGGFGDARVKSVHAISCTYSTLVPTYKCICKCTLVMVTCM